VANSGIATAFAAPQYRGGGKGSRGLFAAGKNCNYLIALILVQMYAEA